MAKGIIDKTKEFLAKYILALAQINIEVYLKQYPTLKALPFTITS